MRRQTPGTLSPIETSPAGRSPYSFRRVALSELPLVNDLYNHCHGANRSMAEAEWLYKANPYGETIVIGAFTSNNRLAGMRPAIAHKFLWGGRERDAYQFIDALVAPEHRHKGIFSRLVTLICEFADEAGTSLFSFPNDNSLRIYRKTTSLRCIGRCEVLVKILSVMEYVGYKLGRRGRTTEVRTPDDELGPSLAEGRIYLTPVRRFDSDFEEAHAEVAKVVASFTLRRQEYLNWRYFSSPERRYRAAVIQESGLPQGYIVVRIINRIAHVIDVFLRPDVRLAGTAVSLLTHWARHMGVIAIYFRASQHNWVQRAFVKNGFLLRRKTDSIVLDTNSVRHLASLHHRPLGISDFYFVMGDGNFF